MPQCGNPWPLPRVRPLPTAAKGNAVTTAIDVCICTFRRPSVVQAMASVARQTLPEGTSLRIIVVDNDEVPSAKARVDAAGLSVPVTYVHAPARNISIARNAGLLAAQGDWLAFLDDDEEAAQGWLMLLLDCAAETGADAVFGPALAIYPDNAPRWMVDNDFHSNLPQRRGGQVETGHSCNALIRRAALPADLRFKPELGRSGGEDTDFFFRLGRSGARLAICDSALVTETVPPHRLSLKWLAERRFAEGRHYGGSATGGAPRLVATGLVKAAACVPPALASAGNPSKAAFWGLRGLFHLGVAAGAVVPPIARRAYGEG